jgi:hypothetical protein
MIHRWDKLKASHKKTLAKLAGEGVGGAEEVN